MPQRIALSEYSGILLSFFHSGSLTNFAQLALSWTRTLEGQHVGQVGHPGADEGFAEENRDAAQTRRKMAISPASLNISIFFWPVLTLGLS